MLIMATLLVVGLVLFVVQHIVKSGSDQIILDEVQKDSEHQNLLISTIGLLICILHLLK